MIPFFEPFESAPSTTARGKNCERPDPSPNSVHSDIASLAHCPSSAFRSTALQSPDHLPRLFVLADPIFEGA